MRGGAIIRARRPRPISILTLTLACLAIPSCGDRGGEDSGAPAPPAISIEGVPEEHYSVPVAVVNGASIYRATYEKILDFLRLPLEAQGEGDVERYIRARTDALERAIDMELLYQEAVRQGHQAGDDEVGKEYSSRVAAAGSEEAYLASARKNFFSKSEVLDGIRHEMTVSRFTHEEIESRLTVADSELREYYALNQEPFMTEALASLGSIFLAAPQGATESERASALTRISEALERIRKGEEFEKVAREVSEDEVAHTGGRMGLVRRGVLPQELETAAFALAPGEVSSIIQTESGYHILKLYEKKGGELRPYEEVEQDVRERVLARKKAEGLRAIVTSLRETATIERLLE